MPPADGAVEMSLPHYRGKPYQKRTERIQEHVQQFIVRCREDPIWFCEQTLQHRMLEGETSLNDDIYDKRVLSWELDDFQKDILNAIADVWRETTVINHGRKTVISVVAGHGPGKTHTAALGAHYFNTCWPGRVIVTAPKFDQVKTRLFAAIHKINRRAEPWYRATHELLETEAYWYSADGTRNQDWCILGETAKSPENLAGHHSPYQLIIVEEATGVPESLFPVIESALSTGAIQILVMISNGTKRTGSFAASHLKPKERAMCFPYRIDFEKSRRVSRKWAERVISKYGRTSPVAQVRVFGEFASDEPGQLIAYEWLAAACTKDCQPDGSLMRRRLSVDVAGGGTASNVLTLCEHYQSKVVARAQEEHSFPMATATAQTIDKVLHMWTRYGCKPENGDYVVVDSIGLGLGVAGGLSTKVPTVFHQGGASSADPKRWRNQRTQSYLSLRNVLRDGQLEIAEGFFQDVEHRDALEAELTALRLKPNDDRVEDLENKDDLVLRLGFSPDHADSLAMQWSSIAPQAVLGATGHTGQKVFVARSRALEGMHR